MIVLDLSILNQKGTPMFNSDIFANRPAFGIVGRIFISTNTAAIYRDTGTAWDLIADGGSSSTNIYNSNGTLSANRTVASGGFSLTINPSTTFATTLTAAIGSGAVSAFGVNTLSYAAAFSSSNLGSVYGAIGGFNLQTFAGSATFANANIAAANTSINSIDFSSGGSTITMTQAAGLRAMAGHINMFQYQGTNSATITHAAICQNLGFYRPPAATGILTITNAYGFLLNDLNDYGAGFTFTNRWGIYQAGASDPNYFASQILIGTTTNSGQKLIVNGSGIFSGSLSTTAGNAILAGGTSLAIAPSATRAVINLGGSTDNFLTFASNAYIGVGSNYMQIIAQTGVSLSFVSDANTVLSFANTTLTGTFANNIIIGSGADTGQRLQVNGAVKFSGGINDFESNSATNYCLKLRNTNANSYGLFIQSASTPNSGFPLINITDSTAATSYFRVDSGTGNVGINTSPGTQKLYLNGSLRIDGQSSGTSGGNSGQHLIINLDGTTYKIRLELP